VKRPDKKSALFYSEAFKNDIPNRTARKIKTTPTVKNIQSLIF